ncbi:hypothetical protein DYI81_05385 [Acinetobacter sp. SWAC5]|nr:hypothetical protein DYI81_05385 [Acinetobacter sp. SWAC5]
MVYFTTVEMLALCCFECFFCFNFMMVFLCRRVKKTVIKMTVFFYTAYFQWLKQLLPFNRLYLLFLRACFFCSRTTTTPTTTRNRSRF